MSFDLFVLCSNCDPRSTAGQIWLHVSKIEQTMLDPEAWPNDKLPLFIACPWCNYVSKHFQAPKAFLPAELQTTLQRDKVWLRVSFLCGMAGCGTPAEFHVQMDAPKGQRTQDGIDDESIKTRILLDLRANRWKGILPCDHNLKPVADRLYRFRWMTVLKGYDPQDQRWNEVRNTRS